MFKTCKMSSKLILRKDWKAFQNVRAFRLGNHILCTVDINRINHFHRCLGLKYDGTDWTDRIDGTPNRHCANDKEYFEDKSILIFLQCQSWHFEFEQSTSFVPVLLLTQCHYLFAGQQLYVHTTVWGTVWLKDDGPDDGSEWPVGAYSGRQDIGHSACYTLLRATLCDPSFGPFACSLNKRLESVRFHYTLLAEFLFVYCKNQRTKNNTFSPCLDLGEREMSSVWFQWAGWWAVSPVSWTRRPARCPIGPSSFMSDPWGIIITKFHRKPLCTATVPLFSVRSNVVLSAGIVMRGPNLHRLLWISQVFISTNRSMLLAHNLWASRFQQTWGSLHCAINRCCTHCSDYCVF